MKLHTPVYKIIQRLRETTSRNDKIAILKCHQDNIILKNFFRLALSPRINFYQKKDIEYKISEPTTTLEITLGLLEDIIAGRKITGNYAISFISGILSSSFLDDAEVIKLVLKKDPDCGVQASTVNKIWKDLVPELPCLLAQPWSDKLANKLDWEQGVFVQAKSDGARVHLIFDSEGNLELLTRAGNPYQVHNRFDYLKAHFKNVVIDGEMLVINKSGIVDRKTGNGLCNKAIKGTLSKEESETLVIVVWDIIPYNDFFSGVYNTPYIKRFETLENILGSFESPLIKLIESEIVYSKQEAENIFNSYLDKGEEGAMVKSLDMIWEDRRSNSQLKMKAEDTLDLEVIGFNPGQGKYLGKIGSLQCTNSDGTILVDVAGLTDEQRSINPEHYIGKIVEVCYNQIIETKTDRKTKSLFLPRIKIIREDKGKVN